MSSTQVAIAAEYAEKALKMVNPGGTIAFPMFPNATKHDIRMLEKEFKAFGKQVKSYEINKRLVIIHVN